MYTISVITPTIGRKSIEKLIQSLQFQNVNIIHFILWDQKRINDGYNPNNFIFTKYHSPNYISYNYIFNHPVFNISRKDNYLRTIGIQLSTTDFITQIDDDCWLENNWLFNAIYLIKENNLNYCFCKRYLYENESKKIGIDDYESIGIKNKFGYHLMETNSIVFTKNIANDMINITIKNNEYGHDRHIAKYLIDNYKGVYYNNIGLHQIVPDFLLDFHNKNISKK